jgi:single-stranded-DNA-specific exonuclease
MKTIWKLKPPSSLVPELARATGLSMLEAQLVMNRGLTDAQAVSSYLSPKLNLLSDPLSLKDMDQAVALIIEALENQETVTVYGDFDADGFTATAVLCNFFSNLGIPVSHYIPDRLAEGYGLHREALKKIARKGKGVLITVDCGTTNQDEIALAGSLGLKVVVTDHHQVPGDFAPRCPVINPHRPDCSFPFKHLAGVGVSFFLAVALRAALRAKGWFNHRPEPDLRDYLDLVALGTVADMVPLLDQNRILVSAGLEKIRHSRWPGIQAIAELADLGGTAVSTSDLAYRMAPRLNASGRMGETEIGVMALTTCHPGLARELAGKLEAMNAERQVIERKIMEDIERGLAGAAIENRRTIVVAGRGWHRGVLGIVASRLADKFHRPVLVLNIENGIASGSGRSIPEFDLYRALTSLAHLFERYGGHKQAAGLSLKVACIEALREEFEELARKEIGEKDLLCSMDVDARVNLKDMDLESIRRIASFSPFGPGNPEPLFYAGPCEVVERRVVGERHLKMKVRQDRAVIETIGFGLAGNLSDIHAPINFIFTPEIDRWQGRDKPRLRIIDMELTDQPSKLASP